MCRKSNHATRGKISATRATLRRLWSKKGRVPASGAPSKTLPRTLPPVEGHDSGHLNVSPRPPTKKKNRNRNREKKNNFLNISPRTAWPRRMSRSISLAQNSSRRVIGLPCRIHHVGPAINTILSRSARYQHAMTDRQPRKNAEYLTPAVDNLFHAILSGGRIRDAKRRNSVLSDSASSIGPCMLTRHQDYARRMRGPSQSHHAVQLRLNCA